VPSAKMAIMMGAFCCEILHGKCVGFSTKQFLVSFLSYWLKELMLYALFVESSRILMSDPEVHLFSPVSSKWIASPVVIELNADADELAVEIPARKNKE